MGGDRAYRERAAGHATQLSRLPAAEFSSGLFVGARALLLAGVPLGVLRSHLRGSIVFGVGAAVGQWTIPSLGPGLASAAGEAPVAECDRVGRPERLGHGLLVGGRVAGGFGVGGLGTEHAWVCLVGLASGCRAAVRSAPPLDVAIVGVVGFGGDAAGPGRADGGVAARVGVISGRQRLDRLVVAVGDLRDRVAARPSIAARRIAIKIRPRSLVSQCRSLGEMDGEVAEEDSG